MILPDLHTPAALLLALLPLLLILLRRRRQRTQLACVDPKLRPWVLDISPRQTGRGHLRESLAWLLLALALAGPHLREALPSNATGSLHPLDLMIVLDVSRSMQAEDLSPNRLDRARLTLHDLLSRLHGERIGLIAYAGTAGLLLPLTDDPQALPPLLEIADEALTDWPGTRLDRALSLAAAELAPERQAAVLLITDGGEEAFESAPGTAVLAAAERLRERDTPLFILHMARDDETLLRNEDQSTQTLRAAPERLEELAERTGGRLIRARTPQAELDTLYDDALARLPANPPAQSTTGRTRELYAWPLTLALLLWLLPSLTRPKPASAPIGLLALLPLALTLPAPSADAAEARPRPSLEAAAHRWHEGDYVTAQLTYARLRGHEARFGEGASAYRRGDFTQAARQFELAFLLATDDSQRAESLYNLGNALFRAGRHAEAAEAYQGAMHYRPGWDEAATNLWLTRTRLDEHIRKKTIDQPPPGKKPSDFARYEEIDQAEFPDDPLLGAGAMTGAATGRANEPAPSGEPRPFTPSENDLPAALKKLELLEDRRAELLRELIRQQAARAGQSPAQNNGDIAW